MEYIEYSYQYMVAYRERDVIGVFEENIHSENIMECLFSSSIILTKLKKKEILSPHLIFIEKMLYAL